MKRSIQAVASWFDNPERIWVFVGLAFVVKCLFGLVTIFLVQGSMENLHLFSGDSIYYIDPLENLILHGQLVESGTQSFGVRMPGFMPIYVPLRLLFPPDLALDLVVLCQVVLSAFACYFLALLSLRMFRTRWIFYVTYMIAMFGTYQSIFDVYIVTESMSTSSLVIAVYLLYEHRNSAPGRMDLIIGFLLTWCVFLKPYFIVLLFYFIGYIGFVRWKQHLPFVRKTLLILAPYVFITLIWSGYLYFNTGEMIVLQKMRGHTTQLNQKTNPLPHLISFTHAFGGQFIFWDPDGPVYDIISKPHTPVNISKFPDAIFSDQFTTEDLQDVKALYAAYSEIDNERSRDSIGELLSNQLIDAKQQYINKRPLDHFVVSRLRCFGRFTFQNASYNIPFPSFENQSWYQKLLKAGYASIYWLVVLFGMIELIIGTIIKPNFKTYYLGSIPGFIVILFPLVLVSSEQRYMVIAYFTLIPLALHLITRIREYIRTSDLNALTSE